MTDTKTINRLFVSSFLTINQLKVCDHGFLHSYLITEDEDDFKHLLWILNHLQEKRIKIGMEELIRMFEFVISPSDRVITGAVYTPKAIREAIIKQCLLSSPPDRMAYIKVADISCGCGSFLMDAALCIHQRTSKPFVEIYKDNIFGIDIKPYSIDRTKIVLSLLALMYGEESEFEFNLLCADTLDTRSISLDTRYRAFDVIVGNPPYVCSRNMSEETKNKVRAFEVCQYGHPDLYMPFVQLAIESLNDGGSLGFITMNSFINSLNGRGLREYLEEKQLEMRIVDFRGYQIFKSRSTYTCLLFIKNTPAESIAYASAENGIVESELRFEQLPYSHLEASKGWILRRTDLVSRIENNGTPLGTYCGSRHGIATLNNKTFIFKPQSESENVYILENKGIRYPIERGICRDIVNSNKLNSEVEFESLIEKAIFPYHIDDAGKAVIYSEVEMRGRFPMALAYLQSQKRLLETRDKNHTETYPIWYAYGRTQSLVMPRYKLFFPKIANKALQCVLIDDSQLLLYNGMTFVSNELCKLQILKCFMESNVFWSYVSSTAKPYSSGFYSLNGINIKKFGIPYMSGEQEDALLAIDNAADRNAFIMHLYGM